MPQLTECVGFNLPDPLTGNPHNLTNFLKGELSPRRILCHPDTRRAETLFWATLKARQGEIPGLLTCINHFIK